MACTVAVEEHIAAPPQKVFATASDFEHAAGRISGIKKVEMLTSGPVGVGTRFKETRVMFGKEATETMEVVAFDPPRGYDLGAFSCGTQYLAEIRIEPDGAGSKLLMTFNAKPVSFFAKLMSPMSFMMKGMLKKCLYGDLQDIKKAAEGGTT